MSKPRLRPAVRALMIDPGDRVLMVRLEFDDWTGWVLPGGGIEPGEDNHTALRRELAEETGVPQAFIGPPVWNRRVESPMVIGGYDGQEEMVYLVPCHRFDVDPGMSSEELRAEGGVEHRWWSLTEITITEESVRPAQLAELIERILEHGAPPEPIQIHEKPDR